MALDCPLVPPDQSCQPHRNRVLPSPPPQLRIRDATVADAQPVADLLAELGYPWPVDVMAARIAAFTQAGESALLAFDGDRALGLVTMHVTPVLHRPTGVGRITAMVVTESSRGKQVGRALVEEAERRLAAKGCALVEVTSNQSRTPAHAFYERLGYEKTSYRFKKSL